MRCKVNYKVRAGVHHGEKRLSWAGFFFFFWNRSACQSIFPVWLTEESRTLLTPMVNVLFGEKTVAEKY